MVTTDSGEFDPDDPGHILHAWELMDRLSTLESEKARITKELMSILTSMLESGKDIKSVYVMCRSSKELLLEALLKSTMKGMDPSVVARLIG